jgi:Protein of unknown function (DUF938)
MVIPLSDFGQKSVDQQQQEDAVGTLNVGLVDDGEKDARQFAPATERNREPILAVLKQVLPASGLVLAPRHWLPSDASPDALASIRAWQQQNPCQNLRSPIPLDVSQGEWPQVVQASEPFRNIEVPLTAIVNINMLHISPWLATLGLMAGAETLLPPGGILYLYGPYKQKGEHTAPSNEAFDAMLKARDPNWGVRHLEEVVEVAAHHSLQWKEAIAMPANNLSVIFERKS